jgi:hypothetical protein
MSALKIRQLPDTTPVKLSIALPPPLQSDLQDYARVYEQAYGQSAKVADLIPSMLEAFMASDSNFKKARKALT